MGGWTFRAAGWCACGEVEGGLVKEGLLVIWELGGMTLGGGLALPRTIRVKVNRP